MEEPQQPSEQLSEQSSDKPNDGEIPLAFGQSTQGDPPSAGMAQAAGAGSAPALSPVAVYAQAMLDEQIARLTHQGYVIVNRTDTSAQLRRRKHFSVWWALFWLIVGAGVGLLVYVAWYVLIKRDRVAFLRITPEGRVMLTES